MKLILPLILSSLLYCNIAYSQDVFVGFIETLEGQAKKNVNGNLKKLSEYDQIFTNESIIIGPNSSINISFIDNSILTLNENSEFLVKEFKDISQEKKFHLEILKGEFTFESGSIAKSKDDAMKIILSEIEVILNGTLVTGENSDESKTIALVEDSLGKVGSLKVIIGDQTTTINEPSAGLNISGSQIQQTTLSADETEQIKEIKKEALVKSSTQSEEDLDRALTKQLANGTIPDANGDGITDANDIEAYKNEIYDFRGERFQYLAEYSTGADMGLMSDIIMNSDPNQSMYLMQTMISYDQGNTTFLMDEVAKSGFDVFSHMAQAEGLNPTMPYIDENLDFNEIRASIVDGMVLDQSEQSIDAIARVMAVSDPSMSSYLVEEISNITPQGNDNFSIDVLASFTEMAPEKLAEFYEEDPETMNKLTTNAFQNADQEDIEMMATIMQETSPKDTALLMTNLVENNPEMIAGVYSNLAEQDFDLFEHIESAKVQPGEIVSVSIANDSMYGTEISDGNQIMNMVVDDSVVTYQEEYFQNFKGEVFAEIIAHSEGTSSEVVAELMMDTTNGDTAMFMMEAVMNENPDVLSEVMNNFADQNFDIFEHIEETTIENDNIDIEDTQSENILITDENLTTPSTAIVAISETTSNSENKIRLSKSERQALKEEKKAKRKAAKIAKQEKRKADRQAAIASRKAANRAARIAAREGNEVEIELDNTVDDLKEFKTEVFKEMIENSNETTMTTMAKLVTTTDNSTASLIFETIISEQNNPEEDINNISNENLALDLMNNLSDVDSEVVETIYETQTDLVNDIVNTALSDISAEDSEAIANIISSSSEEINEMVFSNIASINDQSLTNNVFSSLADIDGGAEAIIAMASTNQSLYENIAQDIDPTYMTAASLLTNTTAQYNTSTTAASATTSSSDTSTYTAGDISWTTYPMSPGTISTSYYVSITGTAESMNGVVYSVSDLPDGLTLDYTTGMIFGTPTSPGTFNTTLTATDIMDSANFATASLTFDIIEDTSGGYDDGGGDSFSFMSTPYPPATLTVNNTMTPIYLYTTGGVGDITFSVTGDLPTGIFIMGDQIMGTPDTQTFSPSTITIIASDEDGNTASTSLTFPQVDSDGAGEGGGADGPTWATYIYGPSILSVGTEMTEVFLDASGTGFVSFTASNLPDGLYIDGEYVRGSPTTQTYSSVSVMFTATDDMGSQTKYVNFPQVDEGSGDGGSVTWTTTQADFPSTMTKGTAISSITLSATGSMEPITYTDDGNLPNGITLTAGVVSGTPQNVRATETIVTFTAEDMDGNEETLTVSFPIINAASGISNPNWITTPTTTGTYTTSSNISISAEAVSVPAANGVIYSASSLPPGITLDTATGLISGTPTTAGTYNSEIKVEDATDSTFQISETLIFNVSGSSSVTWITLDTDFPSTLTVDDPISSIALDADGVGEISYDYTGTLPPGLTLAGGLFSGTPTTQSATSTTITFIATDEDGNDEDLVVTLPQVDASGGGLTWNTTATEFSSLTLTEGTPMSSITLSATGVGTITYDDDAMLPEGISLVAGVVSGTPTSSTETETSVTFTATDEDGNSEDLFVSFPEISAGGGTETVEFDTPAGTLATFNAGDNINETVDATASQGSAITYTFTATNSETAFGLTGTGISVTGNTISGIAPRLYVGATFTFDFTAEIGNGATNSRAFEIDILEDSTCVSPTDNICT